MKKILLSLALALMASTAFVSNAGSLLGLPSGGMLPSSPMDIYIFGDSIVISFSERVVSVSVTNQDTGESHSVNYSPARYSADLPFSRDSGTWVIRAKSEGGIKLYRRFYFAGDPGTPQRPVDWIDEGDPIHDFGGPEWP
jgi:hypothetical protein